MTDMANRYDDFALRSVDAIQVENPWMLEYALRVNQGREVDIRYAPPGIDAHVFHPGPSRNLEQDPYILCVGRLSDPRKNVEMLIGAYYLLPDAISTRVRLVLAGSSAPSEGCWEKIDQLGLSERVSFVSRPCQGALVELYQKAILFALPSDEEGLGIVLLEAMACGVPVVSTRSGGPEGIITEGADGFLVSRDAQHEMADRIRQLCEAPELNVSMGKAARRAVEARFTEEYASKEFIDVWDRLIG